MREQYTHNYKRCTFHHKKMKLLYLLILLAGVAMGRRCEHTGITLMSFPSKSVYWCCDDDDTNCASETRRDGDGRDIERQNWLEKTGAHHRNRQQL
jgi:hypothetical protein